MLFDAEGVLHWIALRVLDIGHNLDIMVDMIPDENPLKSLLREIESLGDYATTLHIRVKEMTTHTTDD